mmetsp:Transcript_11549/g.22184  ORF Transcript_11549/g.22184 Transcript_11549/m.22184 type:complete len:156 (+) Transcript_11549:28-495(+)
MINNHFLNIQLNTHEINSLFQKWKNFKNFTEKLFKIKIFMNIKSKKIEFKSSYKLISLNWFMIKKYTEAVIIGFPVTEASLMLFYDNIYVKSIRLKNNIRNKKKFSRINSLFIGKKGVVKMNIEINAKVRLIIAHSQIHLMGTYKNIKKAELVFY